MKKKMDAFESLVEFSKTAKVQHLRDAMKKLKDLNLESVDTNDQICGTCLFNRERIKQVKNLFEEDTQGPSHCFLSNILGAAFTGEGLKQGDFIVSCVGPLRENWIEDPNTKKRTKLETIEDETFDERFDQAKLFTELTKFVTAIEELAEHKATETKEE